MINAVDFFNCLCNPVGQQCISKEGSDLIKRKGLAVVDCSWARYDDVPFTKLQCAAPRLCKKFTQSYKKMRLFHMLPAYHISKFNIDIREGGHSLLPLQVYNKRFNGLAFGKP